MKKFNFNSILFVFAIAFLIAGIWGNCFARLKWGIIDMLGGFRHLNVAAIMDAKNTIDRVSIEELSYHDLMMEVDSFRNNLLGTRVVRKDDTTIVKAYSDSLCEPVSLLSDADIEEVVMRIQELKTVAEENGAKFLYCAAPKKEAYEQLPSNVENYSRKNFDRLIESLSTSEIPAIDISVIFNKNKLTTGKDIFYYTDHHWRVYSGFLASTAICKELSSMYGFIYNEQYINLQNYTVDLYPKWFLGAKGKKVGQYFSWHGVDDFELITPNFETNMTEEQPFKEEKREGTFIETVLFMDNMEKDYYHKSPYSTYSGGDFRLQIMRNNLDTDGKKILLIRDSFACVVAPFLSLQTSELHICDMRDYQWYVGDKLNMEEYIREINPDYVLVLYNGISSVKDAHGKYDFFLKTDN